MSVLGAIGSVVGGLLGKSKTKSPGEQFHQHIDGVMRAARDWGFNPLTLLGAGVAFPTATVDNSAFGAGIANAFALAGDAMLSKRSTSAKLNQYQQQNERLQSRLNAITLRAPVPGRFGRTRLPSDPEVYSNGNDPGFGSVQSSTGGPARVGSPYRPLVEAPDPADPRRPVDIKPTPNSPGVMVVDSPYMPKMWFPTIDGDEPLDLLDLPSMAAGVPQLAYGLGDRVTFGGGRESAPSWSRERGLSEKMFRDLARKRPKRRPVYKTRPTYDAGWVQ